MPEKTMETKKFGICEVCVYMLNPLEVRVTTKENEIRFWTGLWMADFLTEFVIVKSHLIHLIDRHEDRYVGINYVDIEGDP